MATSWCSHAGETRSRAYVGLTTMQGLGYRHLSKGSPTIILGLDPGYTAEEVKKLNLTDIPGYAYNVGLRLGVNAPKVFSFETGHQLNVTGYYNKTADTAHITQPTWNGKFNEGGITRSRYWFYTVNIPLAFNFTIGKKKVKGFITTGTYITALFMYQGRTQLNDHPPKKWKERPFDKLLFNLTPFVGAGIVYAINRHLTLRALPVFQIEALTPNPSYINRNLYSIGLQVDLLVCFGQMPEKVSK